MRTFRAWLKGDPDRVLAVVVTTAAAAAFLLWEPVIHHHPTEPLAATSLAAMAPKPVVGPEARGPRGQVEVETEPPPPPEPAHRDWGDASELAHQHPGYPSSQALCRSVASERIPAGDRPRPRLSRTLSGCSPLNLYYNTNERRDVVRARMCALSAATSDQPEDGEIVLMNVYANGEGVRRDLDLALHIACGLDVEPGDTHNRVLRLHRLRSQRWAGRDFDYVLDASGSFSGAAGVYYYVRLNGERRTAELRRLTASWTPSQRRAFERVEEAKAAYADAHANAAHYHSSPAGWIWWGAVENVEDAFIAQMRALSSNTIPRYSSVDVDATRQRIAANHRFFQRPVGSLAERGPSDFARAERAWVAYRDAFIAMAQLRSPGLSQERLATWLGRTRPDRWALDISLDLESQTLPFDMDP